MRTEPPAGDELARLLESMKHNVLREATPERPAAPRRPQLADRVIGLVVAVAVLLGLGAGAAVAFSLIGPPEAEQAEAASTPNTAPRPDAGFPISTAAPTPSPTVDPLASVTTIVVRPEGLDLQDAAGTVVAELSYDDDTASFVHALTVALGADLIVEDDFSGADLMHTMYTWPGLRVSDDLSTGPGHPDMNLMVDFDQPMLGDGVAVATVAGFAPGQDLAAYAASVGASYFPEGFAQNLIALETGPELGPSPVPNRVNAHTVVASDWGQSSTGPSTVFAPFNFGHEQGTASTDG